MVRHNTFALTGHLVSKGTELSANVKVPTKTVKEIEYKTINKTIVKKEKISLFEKFKLVLLGMSIGILLVIIREIVVKLKNYCKYT